MHAGVDRTEVHRHVLITDADGRVPARKQISNTLTRLCELHAPAE